MENYKIAVIGLGYVGLPLAIEFSKHFEVIGYDINDEKVGVIRSGVNPTDEVGEDKLKAALNGRLCISTTVDVYDPMVDIESTQSLFGINMVSSIQIEDY